jgi:hypothetical protein
MSTLAIPLWHYDFPGTPSEFSLTPQVLLQVIHPFVKEVAFHLAACFQ